MKLTTALKSLALLTAATLKIQLAQAQACIGQTQLLGQAELGQDEQEEYFAVSDDVNARLKSVYYCIQTGSFSDTHFRGFIATFESDTGEDQEFQFGGMADPDQENVECVRENLSKDIFLNQLYVYSDSQDIEGFLLVDQLGKPWPFKTASGGNQSNRVFVYGPIIGFRVLTREVVYLAGQDIYQRVPIYIQLIYNTCACSQSSFRQDTPPKDMESRAVSDGDKAQYLTYQKDTIGFYHGQDCGSYSITLSPQLPFLELSSSGMDGPRRKPYFDTLTLKQTTAADIGVYEVVMTVLQIPENGDGFSSGSTTGIMEPIEYLFTVIIQPCRVGRYQVDTQPSQFNYIIGDMTRTGAYYNFAEIGSACLYPAKVELTNLPEWATHNGDSQDFSLGYFDDLSLEGTYTVDIKSTVSFPNSATDPNERAVQAQTSFQIRLINPCRLTQFTEWSTEPVVTSLNSAPVLITLSGPQDQSSLIFGNKDGTSLCGERSYTIITQQSVFESFLTFDGKDKFTLQATQEGDLGQHFVTIRATLVDYPTIRPQDTTLTIDINACSVSSLEFSQVPAQSYSVFLPAKGFGYTAFTQSPDCSYQLDYTVRLKDPVSGDYTELPQFIQYSEPGFFVLSTDIEDLGEYLISVTARIPQSLQADQVLTEMLIELVVNNGCAVDEMESDFEVENITFDIGVTGTTRINPVWKSSSVSGCPFTYELFKVSGSGEQQSLTAGEAQFVQFDFVDGDEITIQNEDDFSLEGQSWTILAVKRSTYSESAKRDAVVEVVINWRDPCTEDSIAFKTSIDKSIYLIGVTGQIFETPIWQQTEPNCPVAFSIFRLDDSNAQRPLSLIENQVVQHSLIDGQILITNNNNYSIAKETWDLVVLVRSLKSRSNAKEDSILFQVEWRDPCSYSQLAKPYLTEDTVTSFELFFQLEIAFYSVEDLTYGKSCGGYTNSLVYIEGPVYDQNELYGADLSQFTIQRISETVLDFSGIVNDIAWVGTHSFQIISRNGVFNKDSIRGENGLFGEQMSEVFTIVIDNPCRDSIVNGDDALVLDDMIAPDGIERLESVVYTGPNNSINQELCQNGCQFCGPLSYRLLTEKRLPVGNISWLELQVLQPTVNNQDQFKLILSQNPLFTKVVTEVKLVEAYLVDYPTSKPALLPVTVSRRLCEPNEFGIETLADLTIDVGEPALGIDVRVTQGNCEYSVSVTAFLLIESEDATIERVPLPSFIVFSQDEMIFLKRTKQSNAGNYTIGLEAQINTDYVNVQTETQFAINVIPSDEQVIDPEDESAEAEQATIVEPVIDPTDDSSSVDPEFQTIERPIWLVEPQDQFVAVGNALLYKIVNPVDSSGQKVKIKVSLGPALAFASFSQEDQYFRVHSTQLKPWHIGTYEIVITAILEGAKFGSQYEFVDSFVLEVLPPFNGTAGDQEQTEKDETKQQEIDIELISSDDWSGPIYESIKEAPFDIQSPIPYVSNLSLQGVLRIGWDAKMQSLEDFSVLTDSKVAIKSWEEKTMYQRRKLEDEKFIMMTNETTKDIETFKLVDSLEIVLRDESSNDENLEQKLPWSLLESSEDFTVIQINFNKADSIAPLFGELSIQVTFWGVDFFKSSSEKTVRFGTQLNWKVFRQISADQQAIVEQFDFIFYLKVAIVLIMLPVCLLGNSLPTLMFLNSLQLVAHFPLLNTVLPSNVHQFLIPYLDLVRLKINGWSEQLDDTYDISRRQWITEDNQIFSNNNSLMQVGGYGHLFINNAAVILCVAVLIITIWIFVAIKDLTSKRIQHRLPSMLLPKHEEFVSNFAIRFLYEMYLELAICAMISLSLSDTSSEIAGLQWIVSVVTIATLFSLLIFLVLRMFHKGPFIRGYYQSLTWRSLCCLETRHSKESFNHKVYKKKLRKRYQRYDLHDLRVPVEALHIVKEVARPSVLWTNENVNTERGLMSDPRETVRQISNISPALFDNRQDFSLQKRQLELSNEKISANNSPRAQGFLTTNDVPFTTMEHAREHIVDNLGSPQMKMEPQFDHPNQPAQSSSQILACQESNQTESMSIDHSSAKHIFVLSALGKSKDKASEKSKDLFEGGEQSEQAQPQSENTAQLKLRLQDKAQSKLAMEDFVKVPFRYKTLFDGLKLNHSRNVAVVHPIVFLMRRVLLALIIVYMNTVRFAGLFMFIGFTLFVLAYTAMEHQWQDKLLNLQHIANEIMLYIFAMFLVYFTILETDPANRMTVGYAFIGVFIAWMVANVTFILWQTVIFIKKLMKRQYYLMSDRKLAGKVAKVADTLKNDLNQPPLFDESPSQRSKSPEKVEVLTRRTLPGGWACSIVKEQSLSLDEECPDGQIISHFMATVTNNRKAKETQIVPFNENQSLQQVYQDELSSQLEIKSDRVPSKLNSDSKRLIPERNEDDPFDTALKTYKNTYFLRPSESPEPQETPQNIPLGCDSDRQSDSSQSEKQQDVEFASSPRRSNIVLNLQPIEEDEDHPSSSDEASARKKESAPVIEPAQVITLDNTQEDLLTGKVIGSALMTDVSDQNQNREEKVDDPIKIELCDEISIPVANVDLSTKNSVVQRTDLVMSKQVSNGLQSDMDLCTPANNNKQAALFQLTQQTASAQASAQTAVQRTAKFYEESPENKSKYLISAVKETDHQIDISSASPRINLISESSKHQDSNNKHFLNFLNGEPDGSQEDQAIGPSSFQMENDRDRALLKTPEAHSSASQQKKDRSREESESQSVVMDQEAAMQQQQDHITITQTDLLQPDAKIEKEIEVDFARLSLQRKVSNTVVEKKHTAMGAGDSTRGIKRDPTSDHALAFFRQKEGKNISITNIDKTGSCATRMGEPQQDLSKANPFEVAKSLVQNQTPQSSSRVGFSSMVRRLARKVSVEDRELSVQNRNHLPKKELQRLVSHDAFSQRSMPEMSDQFSDNGSRGHPMSEIRRVSGAIETNVRNILSNGQRKDSILRIQAHLRQFATQHHTRQHSVEMTQLPSETRQDELNEIHLMRAMNNNTRSQRDQFLLSEGDVRSAHGSRLVDQKLSQDFSNHVMNRGSIVSIDSNNLPRLHHSVEKDYKQDNQGSTRNNEFDHSELPQRTNTVSMKQSRLKVNQKAMRQPSFSSVLLHRLSPSSTAKRQLRLLSQASSRGATIETSNVTPIKREILVQDCKTTPHTHQPSQVISLTSNRSQVFGQKKTSGVMSPVSRQISFNVNVKAQTGRHILSNIPRTASVTSIESLESRGFESSLEKQNYFQKQYHKAPSIGLGRAYTLAPANTYNGLVASAKSKESQAMKSRYNDQGRS